MTVEQSLEGYVEGCSWGRAGPDGTFGVKIFVKMTRHFDRETDDVSAHAEAILELLQKNTVLKDPSLPTQQASVEAGYRALFETPIFLRRIPNQYCHLPCCLHIPWAEVTTPIGLFTVGRRKRVISIDWSQTLVSQTAEELFPEEKVTKDGCLIHAWSHEKAKEYIQAIHAAYRGVQTTMPGLE
jgi:hypothetical protein